MSEDAITEYRCSIVRRTFGPSGSVEVLGHADFVADPEGRMRMVAAEWDPKAMPSRTARAVHSLICRFQDAHDSEEALRSEMKKEGNEVRLENLIIVAKHRMFAHEPAKPQPDMVNHPPHYAHASGVECIDITEHMNFCLGNAFKYLFRCDGKGASETDMRKAIWYLQRWRSGSGRAFPIAVDIRSNQFWSGFAHHDVVGSVRRVIEHESGNLASAMALVVRAHERCDMALEDAYDDAASAVAFIEAEIAARTSEAA